MCKRYEEDQIQIFIGSQSDRGFLMTVISEIAPLNFVIDDGSHLMNDLEVSFVNLIGHLAERGTYLLEVTRSSNWEEYRGGHKKPNTFIEYSKTVTDLLNSFAARSDALLGHPRSTVLNGISFFENLIVFEKTLQRKLSEPCIWPPVSD